MKEKYWVLLVLLVAVFSGWIFGWAGYDNGFDEGKRIGQVEGFKEAELLYQAPPDIPRYLELEGPTWEETLGDILEEIDTANITFHIEDTKGVKADIHISWSK